MSSDGDWTVRNGRAMEGMVVQTKEGKLDLDSISNSISSLLGFACSSILPGTSGPGLSLVREVFALVIRRTLLCFITLACWKRSEWEELWKHLGLSAIATIPSAQTAPHYQRLKKALCPPSPPPPLVFDKESGLFRSSSFSAPPTGTEPYWGFLVGSINSLWAYQLYSMEQLWSGEKPYSQHEGQIFMLCHLNS